MKKRISWQEKLHNGKTWEIVHPKDSVESLLIPTPLQLDDLVRLIPPGAVSTPRLLRESLAKTFGADKTCPLCTGIFLRISAEAAHESLDAGIKDVTPYWRVVDAKGKHNPKWPGGCEFQSSMLDREIREAMQ